MRPWTSNGLLGAAVTLKLQKQGVLKRVTV